MASLSAEQARHATALDDVRALQLKSREQQLNKLSAALSSQELLLRQLSSGVSQHDQQVDSTLSGHKSELQSVNSRLQLLSTTQSAVSAAVASVRAQSTVAGPVGSRQESAGADAAVVRALEDRLEVHDSRLSAHDEELNRHMNLLSAEASRNVLQSELISAQATTASTTQQTLATVESRLAAMATVESRLEAQDSRMALLDKDMPAFVRVSKSFKVIIREASFVFTLCLPSSTLHSNFQVDDHEQRLAHLEDMALLMPTLSASLSGVVTETSTVKSQLVQATTLQSAISGETTSLEVRDWNTALEILLLPNGTLSQNYAFFLRAYLHRRKPVRWMQQCCRWYVSSYSICERQTIIFLKLEFFSFFAL